MVRSLFFLVVLFLPFSLNAQVNSDTEQILKICLNQPVIRSFHLDQANNKININNEELVLPEEDGIEVNGVAINFLTDMELEFMVVENYYTFNKLEVQDNKAYVEYTFDRGFNQYKLSLDLLKENDRWKVSNHL